MHGKSELNLNFSTLFTQKSENALDIAPLIRPPQYYGRLGPKDRFNMQIFSYLETTLIQPQRNTSLFTARGAHY